MTFDQNIFNAFPDAVVLVSGGSVVFANSAAKALLDSDPTGQSAGDCLGALSDGEGQRSGSFVYDGRYFTAFVSPFEGGELCRINKDADADDAAAALADSLSGVLRTDAFHQRTASDVMRQYTTGISDERFILNASVYEQSCFRTARNGDNLSCIGGCTAPSEFDSSMFNALETLREAAHSASVYLRRDITLGSFCAGPVYVRGTCDLLERVILNLISNSVKYTPEDGHIVLRASKNDSSLLFTLTDDGCGIPPERMACAFAAYSVPHPIGDVKAGAGLGLAACKSIVQRFGGTILLTGAPGMGTSVTVRLPIAPFSAKEPLTRGRNISFGSVRILTDLSDVLDHDCYQPLFLD